MTTLPRYRMLELVRAHTDLPEKVHPDAVLVDDLNIDGDDATDLLNAIFDVYPVEVPVAEWERHFHSEGELLSPMITVADIARFFGVDMRGLRGVEPITVEELRLLCVAHRREVSADGA